jgi:hypothetical protein
VSLGFLISRSLLDAVVLNNLMAVIGFVQNRIELPGTTTAGRLQAALAWAVFAVVCRLTIQSMSERDVPNVDRANC